MGRRSRSGSHDPSSSNNGYRSTNNISNNAFRRTRPDRRPFLAGEGVPGGHLLLGFTSVTLEAVRFFWRHRTIGSWRSDRVFAPSPVPVSGYCAGDDECAGHRRIWGIGALCTGIQGGATRRYVWLWC